MMVLLHGRKLRVVGEAFSKSGKTFPTDLYTNSRDSVNTFPADFADFKQITQINTFILADYAD